MVSLIKLISPSQIWVHDQTEYRDIENKITFHRQDWLGLLFSRNVKKTRTNQGILQAFLLAAAKASFLLFRKSVYNWYNLLLKKRKKRIMVDSSPNLLYGYNRLVEYRIRLTESLWNKIGYLRRCCELRNYSINFDLAKHVLVSLLTNPCAGWVNFAWFGNYEVMIYLCIHTAYVFEFVWLYKDTL